MSDIIWSEAPGATAPKPVEPHPLLGMFAHPVFDRAHAGLHRCRRIHLSMAIARPLQWSNHIHANAAIRQANRTKPQNRPFKSACEAGEQGIYRASPSEKVTLMPLASC